MKFIVFVDDGPVSCDRLELHTYRMRTLKQWWRGESPEILSTQYFPGRIKFSDIIIEPELENITIGEKIQLFETPEYIFHGIIPVSYENNRFRCMVDCIEVRKYD